MNRALDVAMPLWIALWIALGVVIADELRTLTELTVTVGRVGTAARELGDGLDGLSGLPLIGDRLSDPAHAIEQAGASAEASSRTSGRSVRTASTLLGVAIAAIPSIPVLILYLPARLGFARDRRALRQALRATGDDPRLERWLAARAIDRRPYRVALHDANTPWTGVDELDIATLARAELCRYRLRWPERDR